MRILKDSMDKKIMILGAGGHGKVVGEIALLNNYKVIDFFDDKFNKISNYPFNIAGSLEDIYEKINNYNDFFVAIGDNNVRHNKIKLLKEKNVNLVKLIHPSATVSKFTLLEGGICVMANAVINPGTTIKQGVIVNTSASIDHDCYIADFAHISPNCSLSGNVKIGKFSHLGTGTSIHPGINIGENVKTFIGSRVYKDLLNDEIFKNL